MSKIITNLPKSKLGATVSALYLLIVFLLLLVIGTNDVGGHGNPLVLVVAFVFIITLPLSAVYVWLSNVVGHELAHKIGEMITVLGVFAVSAVFNAAIIYLVIGFLSKAARSLFRR